MEIVDSVDEKIAINCGQDFLEFRDAGCEDCVRSEQDHSELSLPEEGQSGGTESSERGSVLLRQTVRLHDLRLALMIPFLITLIYYQLLFAMMMFRIRYEMG